MSFLVILFQLDDKCFVRFGHCVLGLVLVLWVVFFSFYICAAVLVLFLCIKNICGGGF